MAAWVVRALSWGGWLDGWVGGVGRLVGAALPGWMDPNPPSARPTCVMCVHCIGAQGLSGFKEATTHRTKNINKTVCVHVGAWRRSNGVKLNNLCVCTCRYLETFKAYEHKGSESIQERVDADYAARYGGGRVGSPRMRCARGEVWGLGFWGFDGFRVEAPTDPRVSTSMRGLSHRSIDPSIPPPQG